MSVLENRLAVGHETSCSSCGRSIVRVAPPARSMVEDALRFGEPDYVHPGYVRCPGSDVDRAARIERQRP